MVLGPLAGHCPLVSMNTQMRRQKSTDYADLAVPAAACPEP